MSGRRSNGEGTIYFNKARKRYEGQVSIRDPRSGKTTRRKVSGPTKARVLELIQEVKDRGSRGSVLPTTTRVGDWLEHWIADVLPSEPIKESTRASYIDLARRYLTPEIGEIVSRTIPSVPVRKKEKLIADQPRFGINPDLVIGVASTSTDAPITGDVKYKIAVDSWKNSRSDVAQAAMFAVGHHANTALILTFSTDNGAPDLVLNLGDVEVHRILWHATDVVAPHAAMDDFQRRIRTIVAAAMDRAASTVRATAIAS